MPQNPRTDLPTHSLVSSHGLTRFIAFEDFFKAHVCMAHLIDEECSLIIRAVCDGQVVELTEADRAAIDFVARSLEASFGVESVAARQVRFALENLVRPAPPPMR